jgi:CHAT domain-containing protein/tetratricopeptide (TPR) repeat protein
MADLAGVRPGDVIESWSRDGVSGSLDSPLLLADLEFGQLTRGPVVLEGWRAGAPMRLEVSPDAIGLGVVLRPRWPAALLARYERGRELAERGRLEESAAAWRDAVARVDGLAGGPAAACWLLARIGVEWGLKGHLESSREAYDEATTCAESEDPRWVATILEWQGASESELGHPDVAAAALEVAVDLRDSHPASPVLASINAIHDLFAVHNARGQAADARDLAWLEWERAEREAPASLLLSRALQDVGLVHHLAGDLTLAESTFRRAAEVADAADPRSSTWARAQTVVGTMLTSRGDLAGGEELVRKTLERHRRYAPDSLQTAIAMLNVGWITAARGDTAESRRWAEAALRVATPLPGGRSVRAILLHNIAEDERREGRLDEAVAMFERALAEFKATSPGSYHVGVSEARLASALMERGDLAAAHAWLEAALEQLDRSLPRSLAKAEALVTMGDLGRREGDWDMAEEAFAIAIETLEDLGVESNPLLAQALQGVASARRMRGDSVGATRLLRRAVSILDAGRGMTGRSEEERSLFRSSFHGIYRDLIELLVEQGRVAEAFDVLEASRARSLLAMLASRDLWFGLDLPQSLERERRGLGAEYEGVKGRLAQVSREGPPSEARALQARLGDLRERRLQLDLQLRQSSPRLAEMRDPTTLDAAGVAARLDEGTLLIAYSTGTERTVVFTLGNSAGLEAAVIPAGENELRRRMAAWRRLAQTGPPAPGLHAEARGLYTLLLGPIAARVRGARRIVISADGPLQGLPFAALRDDRGFLVERTPIAFVPSGTVYAREAGGGAPANWEAPAAFGDPRYASGTFAPLMGSRREVAAVAAIFPSTRTYVGPRATEHAVEALERGPRFVHFAVHGVLDEKMPLDSALAFSAATKAGQPDNGMLHAWEVFERVRLDADLVTLSACDSAAGQQRAGEGVIGLTRAFQYAGARSVLASLWTVGDTFAGPFMKAFYAAWARGESKAEALRSAQIDAMRRGQRPWRWAAFQLYGADR